MHKKGSLKKNQLPTLKLILLHCQHMSFSKPHFLENQIQKLEISTL